MNSAIFSSITNIPIFLAYLAESILLSGIFLVLYMRFTPYDEMDLIRKGNTAAAISLGGSITGFVVALASVIIHCVSLIDLAIWGVIALIVQIAAYQVSHLVMKSIAEDIKNGVVSQGIFLGIISLSFGVLNAACMTG